MGRIPTQVFVVLTQEDTRNLGVEFNHIGIWLFDKGGRRAATCKKATVIARSEEYKDFRTATLEIGMLPPSPTPYTLVPTTFDAGQEGKFRIDVFTDTGAASSVGLTKIPWSHPTD